MMDEADVTDSISPMLFAIQSVIDHNTLWVISGAKLTKSAMMTNTPAPDRRTLTLFCIALYASAIDDPISGIKELSPKRAALFAMLSAAPDKAPLRPITAVNMLIISAIPYLKPLLANSINPPKRTRDEILALTDNDRNTVNNGVNTVAESLEISCDTVITAA